jgi:hypothetical protein
MKYIAHRGLFDGPDKEKENSPNQINKALFKGYDVEIDVWFINNEWYLGHDAPTHKVNFNFLEDNRFWIHTKNLDALYMLSTVNKLNYFWHQEDDFTLTSHGYIWTYPGKELTTNSVMVVPEIIDSTLEITRNVDCHGICSDYVNKIKEIRCD